ncbi:hypothetical protein N806_16065 [Rhodococcus sp. P27]|nr:hypothetical protein N806_16065 [Rhodococcus sp. P27]
MLASCSNGTAEYSEEVLGSWIGVRWAFST